MDDTSVNAMQTMNLDQAASYLGITRAGLYWLKRTKKITHYVINRKLHFKREDLDAYLSEVRVEAME